MPEVGLFCTFGLVEIYGVRITFRKYLSGMSFSENIKCYLAFSYLLIHMTFLIWSVCKLLVLKYIIA